MSINDPALLPNVPQRHVQKSTPATRTIPQCGLRLVPNTFFQLSTTIREDVFIRPYAICRRLCTENQEISVGNVVEFRRPDDRLPSSLGPIAC